jgi:hypothetical protein
MIDPNKTYKATGIFTITHIQDKGGLNLFAVSDDAGNVFEGYLDRLDNTRNYNRFNVGDKVRIGCRFSIMSDKYHVKTMTKCYK